MKNIFEGKHFANMIEVKQKTAEALKGIKIDEVIKYFEHKKKNFSIGVLHQMESTLM